MPYVSSFNTWEYSALDNSRWEDIVAVAVEALSWMELEGLSERQAFFRAVDQLEVKNSRSLRMALLIAVETTRRLNMINHLLHSVVPGSLIEQFDLGQRNLLRAFVYWTVIRGQGKDLLPFIEGARRALGWEATHQLELFFGKISTIKQHRAEELPDDRKIAFDTFNQPWFIQYCIRTFGRSMALNYLKSTLKPPPAYIRMNPLVLQENSRSRLEAEGVFLEPIDQLENVFRVLHARRPITQTESYKAGVVHIQDKSSCLSTAIAGISEDQNILDLCAAPGGKTSHMAQLMCNRGEIVSVDYSVRRMNTWKKTVERLGVECANPIIADGQRELPLTRKFDLVMLDPPCTSTGSLGKIPSAKWRLTREYLQQMHRIQERLLETASQQVAIDGYIVYSTCSVTLDENELTVRDFLRRHPEFSLVTQEPFIGSKGLLGLEQCQRLFQHRNECNGYFIAKLRRTSE